MAEATLSYQTIKTTHAAREADDQRIEARKRNLVVLILQWLTEEGYVEAARQLEHETNLDLCIIILKIISNFHSAPSSSRRSNVPQLPRVPNAAPMVTTTETTNGNVNNRPPSAGDILRRSTLVSRKLNRSNSEKTIGHPPPPSSTANGATSNVPTSSQTTTSTQHTNNNNNNNTNTSLEDMSLSFMKVSSVKPSSDTTNAGAQQQQNSTKKKFGTVIDYRTIINDTMRVNVEDNVDPAERLLKPLGGYIGYNSEWRELAQVISRVCYVFMTVTRIT
ncbi:unnamed protein product [Didymodactylos carnosus]|uniref:LisH domain-containing protein n=1 Tax=Didymodactylos carnosus TaxID=1234261 RepID=A0A813XG78_9BILA|nr:unnamed protein product [Didymodactylos carnosus]CAF0869550.1 unnamed protein product [Didymodactylos carnosus]CAF3570368.1 unnamed protein product [Didymodactylos carnosus]CAF3656970.1 unnamed protein product [Didymodactylos carnosus]